MTERVPSAERLAAWSLLGCAVFAVVSLPEKDLPWPWLLAFTLPAAALGRMPQLGRWPVRRALLATAMQTLACFAALHDAGPLSRPAALACTILPPLAYVSIRRRDVDASLGLFLSFCVLLVGTILGGFTGWVVGGYAFAACLVLRSESLLVSLRHARNRTPGGLPPRPAPLLRSAVWVTLSCLVCALAVERTLGFLPSPSRASAAPGFAEDNRSSRNRSVGLDDSFVLDGSGGVLSDLHGEQLVRVRAEVGATVPHDLYLRSGFFAQPDLDRWQIGPLDLTPAGTAEAHVLHRPLPGAAVRWLEIERFAGASKFVLTPPGTCELRDLTDLHVDPAREFLRQRDGAENGLYLVGYQDLPPPPEDLPTDPRGQQLGLTSLPANFDTAPFASLLARWRVRGQPTQIAERIAAGLARHCRYERLDPTGPFAHAIENFLFAENDRHGYCMHFASAAALLLRLHGVPCRIGVGLYGGVPDPSDSDARIYGSQHAHAWVEIPFAGRGYVVFDPTPAEQRGQSAPTTIRDDAPSIAGGGGDLMQTLRELAAFVTQPWLLCALLVAVLATTLHPRRRSERAATADAPNLRTPRRLLGRILRELARAGHVRQRRETLEMFSRELARHERLLPELQAAFAAYQEVRFGGRSYDAPRQLALARALDAVAALPPLAAAPNVTAPQA